MKLNFKIKSIIELSIIIFISLIVQGCSASKDIETESVLTGKWVSTVSDCSSNFSKLEFLSDNSLVIDDVVRSSYNFKYGSEFLNEYWINAGFKERAVFNKTSVDGNLYSISASNGQISLKNDSNGCSTSFEQKL